MNLTRDMRSYCDLRLAELQKICPIAGPFFFHCAAGFVDFLAKLHNGKDLKRKGYIDLISKRFPPAYATFKFRSGAADLGAQLYYVLRCGILHSFSLVPDEQSRASGGRERSVAIFHQADAGAKGIAHLSQYSDAFCTDAVALVAEDFLRDIRLTVERILQEDHLNAAKWWQQYPPIAGTPYAIEKSVQTHNIG